MSKLRATIALEKEASLALSGAEYVREKLTALAGMGSNSLFDQAYAIKFRTKSVDSLVQKTISKKKEKEYQPSDATDLVGMRLLTLYASELSLLAKSVVNFLRFCQGDNVKLVSGPELDDGIREVKVYKSNQNARIYDNVYHYFLGLPLAEKDGAGKEKVQLISYIGEEKSYSSIHIVVNCISHAAGNPKIIPIEIQIRTIFEDAWGEIDHKLEYKFKQRVKKQLPKKLDDSRKSYRRTLASVKGLLEQAGSIAEDVRFGYEQLFDAMGAPTLRKAPDYILHDIHHAEPYELTLIKKGFENPSIKDSLVAVSEEASRLRAVMQNAPITARTYKETLNRISEYQGSLESFAENYSVDIDNNQELEYFVRMEEAILNVWLGLLSSHFDPQDVVSNMSLFSKARDLYFQLEKKQEFRDDRFLNFRLASVLIELGEGDVAEFFLNQSIDVNLSAVHPIQGLFKVQIPHFYSFQLWKKRARVLEMGFKSNNPRINREDQLSIMLEATYFAVVAYTESKKNIGLPAFKSGQLQVKFANNLICFFWEIRDLCRSKQEFELVITDFFEALKEEGYKEKINLKAFYKIVKKDGPQSGVEARYHDTLMKYFHLIGNIEKVEYHRQQLCDRINQEETTIMKGNIDVLFAYSMERTKGREARYKVAIPLN